MTQPRVRLGDLLVEARVISREQLDDVLGLQRRDGRRLGTLLVESGLVSETQVTQILSQQFAVPWVSLYHIDFSRQLLNLVPRELAERYCLVPIFVRRVRGLGETLYVAMDDPSDEHAIREVSQGAGLPVRAMIAPPSDIKSAIRVYYGGRAESPSLSEAEAGVGRAGEERSVEPAIAPGAAPSAQELAGDAFATEPSEAPAASAAEPAPGAIAAPLASAPPAAPPSQPPAERAASAVSPSYTPPPESGRVMESRETAMPRPKGRAPRMITLTLLDGTQVNLPARGAKKPERVEASGGERSPDQLTARDLVAALRAVSHGADASEILGEDTGWEKLFAALLALLLKKHLIADWEFVDEYKKI
ncbi:MAG: hypothetical protein OZ921_00195 [Sorangiineae bacterium]|nr:hypothetical protein [Polyangiaceae bacterium]MEB2320904.1 hypothetical protein [Sorangiineae bacterium]